MVPRFGMYPTQIREDCYVIDKTIYKDRDDRMKDEQSIQRMVCVLLSSSVIPLGDSL